MEITIIAMGKLKEKYWREAVQEYALRLKPYLRLEIKELLEEKISGRLTPLKIEQALIKEGKRILKVIPREAFLISLAISGEKLSSEGLAALGAKLGLEGKNKIVFIIGSSHGISREIMRQSNYILSFSTLTFPHQLMRVILLEQIYRSVKILKKEPYHK